MAAIEETTVPQTQPEEPGTPAPVAGDPMNEAVALLRRIQEDTAEQKRYAKRRFILSGIGTGLFACLAATALFAVNGVLPRVNGVIERVDGLLAQAQPVLADLQPAAANLKAVSEELEQADIAALVGNAGILVENTGSGVAQALAKLDSLDIDTLNRSIQDLYDTINPLASFFGGGKSR